MTVAALILAENFPAKTLNPISNFALLPLNLPGGFQNGAAA